MEKPERKFHCHGCRKIKVIVKRAMGMNYCEDCKGRAPSPKQYKEYVHEHSFNNFGKRTSGGRKKKELYVEDQY